MTIKELYKFSSYEYLVKTDIIGYYCLYNEIEYKKNPILKVIREGFGLKIEHLDYELLLLKIEQIK